MPDLAIRNGEKRSKRFPGFCILCVKTKPVERGVGRARDKQRGDDRLSMCKEKRRTGGFYVMLMPKMCGRVCRPPLGRSGVATDK